MKISKIHESFSDFLKEPKARTNPEDFLGPNWEDVINFWLYIDGLSGEEMERMDDRYWASDYDVLDSFRGAAEVAAEEVVGWKVGNAAWKAVYYASDSGCFSWATYELIASHKLLEQNKTLVALPICLKS
jgi:hypothetical protein